MKAASTGLALALVLFAATASAAASDRDSIATGFGHYPPGKALAVGLASTLAPALLMQLVSPIGGESDFAWEAALGVGGAAGVLVGPAVGLASGGRGDLAGRGLLVRGVCVGAMAGGVFAVATMLDEEGYDPGSLALFSFGVAGAVLCAISSIHDLAVTPSSVARGRPVRTAFAVRPDGKVAVSVRF